MNVNLDNAEEVTKKTVSSSGQVYIGKEYSGENVRVAFEVLDE